MSLLTLENVHTYYGEAHILQGVSVAVGEGEVVTLIGRNGAGKTTTLRSIMGIVRARQGRVRLRGEDITALRTDQIARRGIAWIPEERRVLPNLTVLENLRLGMLGRPAPNGGGDVLDEVFGYFPRLRERISHRGRFLSGGEQQMLAISRALMTRPRLLMLDEPSQGIAPKLVDEIFAAVVEIRRAGTTVLLVEQRMTEALEIADRAYVLQTGRVTMQGTAAEISGNADMRKAYLRL